MLSLHVEYGEAILNGTKTYEYRRKAPRIEGPTRFLLYLTSPRSELAGEIVVEEIVSGPPANVWRETGSEGGIARAIFDRYFAGRTQAHALRVKSVRRYARPVGLAELRRKQGFTPPQFLCWLPEGQAGLV